MPPLLCAALVSGSLLLSPLACASPETPAPAGPPAGNTASAAPTGPETRPSEATAPGATTLPLAFAAADSVTTHLLVSSGIGQEVNGLVNTSPAGLAALFLVKAGVIELADRLPEPVRRASLSMLGGLWGGVAGNNLLVLVGAANPVALAGGVLAAVGAYWWEEHRLSGSPAPAAGASQHENR